MPQILIQIHNSTEHTGHTTEICCQTCYILLQNYTADEIEFLLLCCDTNHEGNIEYGEFTGRFLDPAKEIGFGLAVLLTNLSEHMPSDPRLAKFLETAGTVLNFFEQGRRSSNL